MEDLILIQIANLSYFLVEIILVVLIGILISKYLERNGSLDKKNVFFWSVLITLAVHFFAVFIYGLFDFDIVNIKPIFLLGLLLMGILCYFFIFFLNWRILNKYLFWGMILSYFSLLINEVINLFGDYTHFTLLGSLSFIFTSVFVYFIILDLIIKVGAKK